MLHVQIINYGTHLHFHHIHIDKKIPPWPTCCQVLSSQPVSEPDIHYDYEVMVVMLRMVVMVTMVMMVMVKRVMMVMMMIGAEGSQ